MKKPPRVFPEQVLLGGLKPGDIVEFQSDTDDWPLIVECHEPEDLLPAGWTFDEQHHWLCHGPKGEHAVHVSNGHFSWDVDLADITKWWSAQAPA